MKTSTITQKTWIRKSITLLNLLMPQPRRIDFIEKHNHNSAESTNDLDQIIERMERDMLHLNLEIIYLAKIDEQAKEINSLRKQIEFLK